jgi:hypothetical protein
MKGEISYYKALRISHSASTEEIQQAFRKQAKKWHPDKNVYFSLLLLFFFRKDPYFVQSTLNLLMKRMMY